MTHSIRRKHCGQGHSRTNLFTADFAELAGPQMNKISHDLPITISVPDYGLIVFELGRSGSYEAAKAKAESFPVIEVQGKKRVPVRVALRKLAGDDPEVLKAITADFASKFFRLKADEVA